MYFETERLNYLADAEYNEHFGFFQRTFGVYSYMQMNRYLKYKIHYPQGTPFMWQPHNSCAWTPTGTLSMATKEIEPCRAKINEQFCYDEWMDSAYEAWLSWEQSNVAINEAGRDATDALVRTLLRNATVGARAVNVAGQLLDTGTLTFEEGTPTNIRSAFLKSADVCRGWIALARALAAEDSAKYGHMENGLITAGNISSDGESYTGSFLSLYDAQVAAAPKKLRNAIESGGVTGISTPFYPMMLVSPSMISALYQDWLTQKSTTAVNDPRIERREYTVDTPRGPRPMYVYFVDGTVIIPVEEVELYDNYLTTTSHFAYLTVSGAIQMGGSFASIPEIPGGQIAMAIQASDLLQNLGTYSFLSHALFASAINDKDMLSGDFAIGTPV